MFSRLGRLIKGFFGLFVGGLERKNPDAPTGDVAKVLPTEAPECVIQVQN